LLIVIFEYGIEISATGFRGSSLSYRQTAEHSICNLVLFLGQFLLRYVDKDVFPLELLTARTIRNYTWSTIHLQCHTYFFKICFNIILLL